jgi:transposase
MCWTDGPLRHRVCQDGFVEERQNREPSVNDITTIGLDLAKHVFQVHGVNDTTGEIIRKRLRRSQVLSFFPSLAPCLVGMEACATAHYWARELQALGHEVRLIPPQYVKPYLKRNKNDAADAEAICEAVKRPSMQFVPVKTAEQQSVLTMHRGRALLIRQRTMLVNALRAHLAEFGIIAPLGLRKLDELFAVIENDEDTRVPDAARQVLRIIAEQIAALDTQVDAIEMQITGWHKSSTTSRRLATIITASAIAATVPDASVFRNGREFAAWLGLVPRQNSTGGETRLGRISKRGDRYLRRLLVNGAHAVLLRSKAARNRSMATGLAGKETSLGRRRGHCE